jgi:hypothetical protein
VCHLSLFSLSILSHPTHSLSLWLDQGEASMRWLGVITLDLVCATGQCVRVSEEHADGWMAGWLDGWMAGWMAGWLAGWLDGWMDGWMDTHSIAYFKHPPRSPSHPKTLTHSLPPFKHFLPQTHFP